MEKKKVKKDLTIILTKNTYLTRYIIFDKKAHCKYVLSATTGEISGMSIPT